MAFLPVPLEQGTRGKRPDPNTPLRTPAAKIVLKTTLRPVVQKAQPVSCKLWLLLYVVAILSLGVKYYVEFKIEIFLSKVIPQ